MKPQAWKKKGAILVYVVLIMALLIVFGVGMIFLANHNSNTTVNEVYAEQAYLTARSGLRSTMTMMEEDTAKTSDVASQLKTAKTLTSSVDLTANKLGTVSVQVSCTDTDCTILQIDSTGTYQGVSQTVTGYMKSSAPAINSPFVVFNDVSGNTNANTKVIGFNGDSLPITSQNMNYENETTFDVDNLDASKYKLIDCTDVKTVTIIQRSVLYVNFNNKLQGIYSNNNTVLVLYNIDSAAGVVITASANTANHYFLVFPDAQNIDLMPFAKNNVETYMNAWIVAPNSNIIVDEINAFHFKLKGGIVAKTFEWGSSSKWTVDGTGQDPTENTAFMNLYNQLAGGGWTRSYEKP